MFWPCYRVCPSCVICQDDYERSGSGVGSGEVECLFSGGEGWSRSGGFLVPDGAEQIVFLEGPLGDDDPVSVSVTLKPDEPPEAGRVRLLLGVLPNGNFVYGDLDVVSPSGGVYLSVGTHAGELQQVEVAPSGGLGSGSGSGTLYDFQLCWRPAIPLFETSGSYGMRPIEINALDGIDGGFYDKDGALSPGGLYAYSDSLGEGESKRIGATFRVVLPPNGTVYGVSVTCDCREEAQAPNNNIFDAEVLVSVGGESVDVARQEAIPAFSFGTITYGGPTDDMGFSPEALETDNINANGFASVDILFQCPNPADQGGGTAVAVDSFEIAFFVVQRHQVVSRLVSRFSILQGGQLRNWCAVANDVEASGGGLAGLQPFTSNWQFGGYSLRYMNSLGSPVPGCAICGECFNIPTVDGDCCCGSGQMPQAVILSGVNVTAGEYCCALSGGYILEVPGAGDPDGSGSGTAPALPACPMYGYAETCSTENSTIVRMDASVWAIPGQGCRWVANIDACFGDSGTVVQDPSDPDENVANGVAAHATYWSDPIDPETGTCTDFPVTLSLVSQVGDDPTITFPATITLDEATVTM